MYCLTSRTFSRRTRSISWIRGRPLAVDRQPFAVGEDERELDHLAVDPEVHVDHLGGELAEGVLKDVLARRAPGAAAEQHGLDPAGRGLHVLFHAAALFGVGFQSLHGDACVG